MKTQIFSRRTLTTVIAAASFSVSAHALNPPEPNLPIVGGGSGQIIRLKAAAGDPAGLPCIGELGFRDKNGKPIGPSKRVRLAPGEDATLDFNLASVVSRYGERVEARGVVQAESGKCGAALEVVEIWSGRAVARLAPQPRQSLTFSRTGIGLAPGQTARLAIGSVDNPDLRCLAGATLSDAEGGVLAQMQKVFPLPGQTTFLEFTARRRMELLPAVKLLEQGRACVVTLQVFDTVSGWTQLFVDNPDI